MNILNLSKKECTTLKGIAIITVLLSHSSGVCEIFRDIPVLNNKIIFTALCEAGMPLFLFLSGYGLRMSYNNNGLTRYWFKRLLSVFIPYFVVQSLTMIIYFVIHGNDHSIVYNLSVLFGINAANIYDPTMWYISYILFWYFMFWVTHILFSKPVLQISVLALGSLAGFIYVPFYWGNNADYCILPFLSGVVIAYISSMKKLSDRSITQHFLLAVTVISSVTGFTILIYFHRLNIITENIGSLLSMAALVLIVKLIHTKTEMKISYSIGNISFWLYLLEWKLLIKNPVYSKYECNYLTYTLCLLVTFITAYICYVLHNLLLRKHLY
ncbi:MAG: acyltransferase [Lachnospiraceae bacterium]|nr:acyltransferase [Lachnospiraceae bacterium]